ncbi:MAG: GntR family transcriptional regulator [Lachnospira sp.]|nr:GntR family transcriptional regulator [Lachnospira sp.]
MKIIISANSSLPIYEQIINQVRDAVVAKKMLPGEAMPSIRVLAKDLQVSVITTKRAYEDLEKEGVIMSVPGKGFYVCEQSNDILKEKQIMLLEERYAELISDSRKAGMELSEIVNLVKVLYEEG